MFIELNHSIWVLYSPVIQSRNFFQNGRGGGGAWIRLWSRCVRFGVFCSNIRFSWVNCLWFNIINTAPHYVLENTVEWIHYVPNCKLHCGYNGGQSSGKTWYNVSMIKEASITRMCLYSVFPLINCMRLSYCREILVQSTIVQNILSQGNCKYM